jgi:SAM-dependent methyltransferase
MFENRGLLRLLDVGCGRNAKRDYFRALGHTFFGLDVVNPSADVIGTVVQLPFRDCMFDGVLSGAMLSYVIDLRQATSEMFRVIVPRGSITGTVSFLEPWVWGTLVHLTPGGIARLLEDAGFEIKYIWPGWFVADALRESLPNADVRIDAGFDELQFAGSVHFHAMRPR